MVCQNKTKLVWSLDHVLIQYEWLALRHIPLSCRKIILSSNTRVSTTGARRRTRLKYTTTLPWCASIVSTQTESYGRSAGRPTRGNAKRAYLW